MLRSAGRLIQESKPGKRLHHEIQVALLTSSSTYRSDPLLEEPHDDVGIVPPELVGLLGQGHDERAAVEGQLLEVLLEGRPGLLAAGHHGDDCACVR